MHRLALSLIVGLLALLTQCCPKSPPPPPPAPCSVCADAVNATPADPLCPPSATKHAALVSLACVGACAASCAVPGAADCLQAWAGNAPAACKACLASHPEFAACLDDDGTGPPVIVHPPVQQDCACPPGMPLCSSPAACSGPGSSAGSTCGSAAYCAPCCDPFDPVQLCPIHGMCAATKVAGAACASGYECCSGVCSAGACVGGCGVVLGAP